MPIDLFSYLKPYFEINSFAVWLIATLILTVFIRFPAFPRWTLWASIGLGVVLRIAWLWYSSHTPGFSWEEPLLENTWINMNAVELTEGKWFYGQDGLPSGRRPIGYPMVLGLCYAIFGVHAVVAWVLHLVLFVCTAYFIYMLSRDVFGERVGRFSVILFSIYPISIYSVKLITDEHLFLFLWFGGMALLVRELSGKNLFRFNWIFYGLIFGFAAMTRTYAIYMPVVIGLAYCCKKIPLKQVLSTAFLTLIVMQLINLPWLLRNYKVWKVPVVYAVAGHSVYFYANPMATPEIGHLPVSGEPGYSEEFHRIYKSGNDGQIQQAANREVRKWFFEDPVNFSKLAASKLLYFMHWGKRKGVWPLWYQFSPGNFDPGIPPAPRLIKKFEHYAFVFYYILFHLGLAGCVLAARMRKLADVNFPGVVMLLACLFFWCSFHLIIMPDPKYRFPIEPILMIFTAFFCTWLNSRISNSLQLK